MCVSHLYCLCSMRPWYLYVSTAVMMRPVRVGKKSDHSTGRAPSLQQSVAAARSKQELARPLTDIVEKQDVAAQLLCLAGETEDDIAALIATAEAQESWLIWNRADLNAERARSRCSVLS